ncbi:hypothetical protein N8787_02955 [Opitutaceae bacterium]|nr:hypothetical protein [Opitutaceae bacterium]
MLEIERVGCQFQDMERLLILLAVASSFIVKADPILIAEHVYGGLPSNGHILHRTAYIQDWDADNKAPRWVAYHLNAGKRTLFQTATSAFNDFRLGSLSEVGIASL